MYLSGFQTLQTQYSYLQKDALELLAKLHLLEPTCRSDIRERMEKVCCKEDKIGKRQTSITNEWLQNPRGFSERSHLFQERVEEAFSAFYPETASAPSDLIHVTCTGYNSPSAAQKIVVQRGWEKRTTVTHCYHMGCMAALPALRMGMGFAGNSQFVDIVHTELCSLHLNPSLHKDEQLVAQSLFADGLIKYSLTSQPPQQTALRVLTVYEELIPDTADLMKWECADWGLEMTLSREIPFSIARSLGGFIQTLEERSGRPLKEAIYALHPGGPKIIEIVAKKLCLSKKQLATSEKILYNYGNMSSATVPYIWNEMLHDEAIPIGSTIVGLAFGPGLCMAGSVLQKVAQR